LVSASVELVEQKYVGLGMRRREDLRFIQGQGMFLDDVKLPDLAYAYILRSPYAHARIKRVDASKALRLHGVLAVLTGEDVKRMTKPFHPMVKADKITDYCMAVDKVRFAGEPVAAVVAEDRATAEDAAELVDVEYEPLPPVTNAEDAMKPDAPLLHEAVGSNVVWHESFVWGDVEQAFRKSDLIVKESFHFHRFSSTPSETVGIIAHYDHNLGILTVWNPCITPMGAGLPQVSEALGIPTGKIRMISPDIGGAFGIKQNVYPYIVLVSLLSIVTGRPVKWVEDRREHLAASTHGNEVYYDVEAAVRKDGTILGAKIKAVYDEGSVPRYEPIGALIWIQVTPGCYRFKNISMEVKAVVTNKCPVGPNRGYGRMQHMFCIERMVDRVARRLGLDPAEVRFKNLIRPEEMPYTTPSGGVYDGGDYPKALAMVLDMLKYNELKKEQAQLRKEGKFVGVGVAFAIDSGGNNFSQARLINPNAPVSGNSEAAMVRIDENGQAIVAVGTIPQGQGHETTFAQIAADALGLSVEKVFVLPRFDSQTHPFTGNSGTYATRSLVFGGYAILGAAKEVREKILQIASHRLGASINDLEIRDGVVYDKRSQGSITFQQIANYAYRNTVMLPPGMRPGLHSIYYYKPDFKLPDEKKRLNCTLTYSYQAHGVVVEVDLETGKVQIKKYVIVDDCGTRINPAIVDGQVFGAAAHGLGAALYESFIYDRNGQLLTSTFMDYLVPTAVEMPNFEVQHIETPSTTGPLGARGVGEGGGTPLPAIASAIEDALTPFNITITDSHNPPERLYRLIKASQKS